MNLRDVTTTACPVCGCEEVVMEHVQVSTFGVRKVNQHVNGTRWESRKFLCGYETQYIPNFTREEKRQHCSNDPEIKRRNELREKSWKATLQFIENLEDIDAAYKMRLADEIKRTQYEFK